MRNFGNDSYGSQQHYHAPSQYHHQLSYPPPPLGLPPAVKMEPFPLAKSIGAGSNLKQLNKSHFSPVNIVAPTPHDHHHPHQNHFSSSGHNTNNNNNGSNNGIPINLSHASGNVASSSSAAATTVANHHHGSLLPTAALAAACPTPANRGPSPTHHQIPNANGLPYHPSHSPTLPVANTALPYEIHNAPKPASAGLAGNTGGSSPYHHSSKASHFHNSPPTDLTVSNSPNSGNRSGVNPGLTSRTAEEVTPTQAATSGGNPQMSHGANGNNTASSNTTSNSNSSARIVSQNVNGTLAVTGIPTNESELQLFRVLQRANLLSYFDMMIELGGDDVQQLCEAGEAEFLEIMALIGMAAKPLHVRRLQKALQEWMTQPGLFQSPVLPPGYYNAAGVSHVDRTISHTQYTTTTIASSNVTGGTGQNPHHPQHPIIPIPQHASQTPVSPYPAHNAPSLHYITDSNSTSSNDSSRSDSHKVVKSSHERSSSSSPLSNATMGGLQPTYLTQQQGSPSIPVVISTSQSYPGQGQSSNLSSSESHYQNCPSPSGSTSSRSSTISIRSHHHHHPFHPSSPMENSPGSPASSESGQSCNKHGESESTTSSELENASCSYDQTNSPQTLDNSSGTTTAAPSRVTSRSSSRSSSYGGSEPSSPHPPAILPSSASMTKGIILQTGDSPRPSTESVTNRAIPASNNSVTATSHDYYSLQEHEIQKLAEAAVNLVRSLPQNVKEPKFSKKIETSSYEIVLRLAEDDPRKMDEIRRLSAIFGRNEQGKRNKNSGISSSNSSTKPVSILELAMNESAAQLCRLVPALLTRREELFTLSRQVIRDSGLPYSVISASSNLPGSFMFGVNNNNNNEVVVASKLKNAEIRNSPAHEERITHEFAAACKKIKFDMQCNDNQDKTSHHAPLSRKSPLRDNIVTATALKRMALATPEFRKNSKSSLIVHT